MGMSVSVGRINTQGQNGGEEVRSVGISVMAGLFLAVLSVALLASCGPGPQPVEPTEVQLTPSRATPITTTPTLSAVSLATSATLLPTATRTAVSTEWKDSVSHIVWAAYSPPTANPDTGVEAMPEAVGEDLIVLRKAGFTGLVTYSSSGMLGRKLPVLAESLGFQGLILGIWDPSDQDEIAAAEAAAEHSIVLGFCIGNEGLHKRYEITALSEAIESLRQATGKPIATTEEIDDYSDRDLLLLGDWIFPNVHPYFHHQLDPEAAVRWTQAAFDDMQRQTDRFVIFKEVGLPTAGDPEGRLSEENQDKYYSELVKTTVRFVYFEAFDQPWKTHLPVEPHWGLFRSDRTPKLLGLRLMGVEPTPSPTTEPILSSTPEPTLSFTPEPTLPPTPKPTLSLTPEPTLPPTPKPTLSSVPDALHIYADADSPLNRYKPTGYIGDTGDIHVNEAFKEDPHSGKTCIRIVYDAQGKGPNECPYSGPCKWAGVYWLEPPNNWGKDPLWQGKGFDLSSYNRLVFWARADRKTVVEFKVGGINEAYGDSLIYPRTVHADLTEAWQEFQIDLGGADLAHIIGGFAWVTNWDANPSGITFYLDDIRFEE